MREVINEKVSVVTIYDREKNTVLPWIVKWQGRRYKITKFGYRHTQRIGRVLHHIFSVSTNTMFFKLNFNTENLIWTLEEVADGLAS
jgi:hypothetical protein